MWCTFGLFRVVVSLILLFLFGGVRVACAVVLGFGFAVYLLFFFVASCLCWFCFVSFFGLGCTLVGVFFIGLFLLIHCFGF